LFYDFFKTLKLFKVIKLLKKKHFIFYGTQFPMTISQIMGNVLFSVSEFGCWHVDYTDDKENGKYMTILR